MSSNDSTTAIEVEMHNIPPAPKKRSVQNPIIILMGILFLATLMTYFVDSGTFQRDGKLVVPGSYAVMEKDTALSQLFAPHDKTDPNVAHPVSFIDFLMSVPKGLEKGSGLIFMVLMIGGMFGIIKQTGAIEAGLERLLSIVKGNVYVLVTGLMIIFSAGSTFLGLASEYLLVIPIMVALSERMGMSNLIGLALVTVAVKVGYIASVTNPLPLTIAQPLLDLPIFSGLGFRLASYFVFLAAGLFFMIMVVRKSGFNKNIALEISADRLHWRQTAMLSILVLGIAFLVYASSTWQWKHEELTAYYIFLALIMGAFSGLGASGAADAFVAGMKKILLATILIGVATAVSVVLAQGMILDTIVHGLTSMIGDGGAGVAASGMFFSQLMLDFLIPSTSGQAAVSMPILGPIGQITSVPPQTTVLAFLFGNSVTNMLTPTSGTLLAYLATAQVSWSDWAKFILPLWAAFIVISLILLNIAVVIGY